jgi:hypothetical protein
MFDSLNEKLPKEVKGLLRDNSEELKELEKNVSSKISGLSIDVGIGNMISNLFSAIIGLLTLILLSSIITNFVNYNESETHRKMIEKYTKISFVILVIIVWVTRSSIKSVFIV